jgi:chloramphenicol O-acetyltransferase type A
MDLGPLGTMGDDIILNDGYDADGRNDPRSCFIMDAEGELMRIVDKQLWNRRTSYNTFLNYSDPTFSVTTRLDVTNLFNRCKREGTSFFTDFLFIVMRCINGIDEMRMRIVKEDVIIYDTVDPSFMVIRDDESIVSGSISMTYDYPMFYNRIRDEIEYLRTYDQNEVSNTSRRKDVITTACLPWVDFTSNHRLQDPLDKETNSIPHICWGKIVGSSERRTMAFCISAHHSLMDGYHVSRLVKEIQDALDDPAFFNNLI